jgi:hypothetical protein
MRGIRAATVFNNIVIFAGPNLAPAKGIAFFAWNATTGEFLGGYSVLGYNNIRQFLNLTASCARCRNQRQHRYNHGRRDIARQSNDVPGCVLIRRSLFLMNEAFPLRRADGRGNLQTVSVLTAHNGRIFTATWSSTQIPGSQAQLYMSPPIPEGGLTNANANQWQVLWKASDYDPDLALAQSYAGGGIASFDGYLWWGTLHIPMAPFMYLINTYPPTTQDELLQDMAGTMRSTVLFRIKDPETNPKIDLVYGDYQLPVFTPPNPAHPGGSWALKVNNMNKKSLYGPSGYGNVWNTYTWSAAVWNNRLWIGTMDYGFGAEQGAALLDSLTDGSLPPNLFTKTTFGADYLYFTSASKPAFPESTNGVDNPTTYGIRNQLRSSNGILFLGMANNMSLLTDPADPKHFGGLGGWELIELSPSPNLNTPVGTNVTVSLGANTSITYRNVTSQVPRSVRPEESHDPSFVVHPLLLPRYERPAVLPGIWEIPPK